MGIKVLRSGLHTTVQDLGRPRLRRYGIPQCGVLDKHQYFWANGILGNDLHSPVLCIKTIGPTLLFTQSHYIYLTGSPAQVRIDNKEVAPHFPIYVEKGQQLEVKSAVRNGTIYLAIQGNWQLEKIYNSYSTDILTPFPGLLGRSLAEEDNISIFPPNQPITPSHIENTEMEVHQMIIQNIRILTAPESDWLTTSQKSAIEATNFTIHNNSNSMGIRLTTDLMLPQLPQTMLSSMVQIGTVQWPAGGQPILLLNQAQTTGGYPRLAQVIQADLHKLAYLGAGDQIKFKWSTLKEAFYIREYTDRQFEIRWKNIFNRSFQITD